jgi:predicted transcriptional regulator
MYYMATITLRVPDELDEALERQSTAAGVSKSDLAREALRRFLAVSELQRLRTRLVQRAQAQGIHTDEDVFRALDRS